MVKKTLLLLSSILLAGWALLVTHPAFGELAEGVRRRYLITRTEEKAAKAWDVFERQRDQSLQFLTSLGETKYQRFVDRYVAPRSGESPDEVQARLQNQPIYKADLLDMAPIGVGDLEGDPVIMRVTLGAKGALSQVRLFDSAQNKLILDFTTELSIDDRAKVQLGQAPGIFLPREVRLAKGLKEPEEYRAEKKQPPESPEAPPAPELCRDPADPSCKPSEVCRDHWQGSRYQWGETCYDPITITETNCLGETRSSTIIIPPDECPDPFTPIIEECKDATCPTRVPGEGSQMTPEEARSNLMVAMNNLAVARRSEDAAAIETAEKKVKGLQNLVSRIVSVLKIVEKKKEEEAAASTEEGVTPRQDGANVMVNSQKPTDGTCVDQFPEANLYTMGDYDHETDTSYIYRYYDNENYIQVGEISKLPRQDGYRVNIQEGGILALVDETDDLRRRGPYTIPPATLISLEVKTDITKIERLALQFPSAPFGYLFAIAHALDSSGALKGGGSAVYSLRLGMVPLYKIGDTSGKAVGFGPGLFILYADGRQEFYATGRESDIDTAADSPNISLVITPMMREALKEAFRNNMRNYPGKTNPQDNNFFTFTTSTTQRKSTQKVNLDSPKWNYVK